MAIYLEGGVLSQGVSCAVLNQKNSGEKQMKKLASSIIAMCILATSLAFAADDTKKDAPKKDEKAAAPAKKGAKKAAKKEEKKEEKKEDAKKDEMKDMKHD